MSNTPKLSEDEKKKLFAEAFQLLDEVKFLINKAFLNHLIYERKLKNSTDSLNFRH